MKIYMYSCVEKIKYLIKFSGIRIKLAMTVIGDCKTESRADLELVE